MIPPRRPELLADAIQRLSEAPERRDLLGRRARESVARYSADDEWHAYATLYEDAIARRRRNPFLPT
jgi:glycosyltransferase involved in cell wall biosynthesis